MKVTVYFGNVRVIVPCGRGDILVRDLMDLAITRYKKATGKSQSSSVTVRTLKSSRDEGILYPDDKLNDVADDREQIIAVFHEEEEEDGGRGYSPGPRYDVTSTSSLCTGSPDLFSVEVGSHCSAPYGNCNTDTEDGGPLSVIPLQVRRGSEPALNCLFPQEPLPPDPSKRWSTAVAFRDAAAVHENGGDASPVEEPGGAESKLSSLTTSFSRGSGRLSILAGSETQRWVEAADRQLRKEFNENVSLHSAFDASSDISSLSDEREKTIILKNEDGPLGIHVVPDYDSKGRDTGLVIQNIESGGRIDRDGRLRVGDRITEINGCSLQRVSFQAAQEIFKAALRSPTVRLELVRPEGRAATPKKPPAPVFPPPPRGEKRAEEEGPALVEGEERAGGVSTKVATVTPTKKMPSSAMRRLASANTRRIGKMLTVELTKGSSGLGFSITTRDNPAGGNSPIYIKNVLPKGAAIEDGRLQPGDRLLEVNGVPMTGKTQTEAVSVLRNIPLGRAVQLVVSRQEVELTAEPDSSNGGTRPAPSVCESEAGIFPWKHREILTFQIPLVDSHSAGLGVSVKGKSTATDGSTLDLGIFVKSVIPGGAAAKDGRLQTNDQLVNINGISLLGTGNSNAMETLRGAMTQTDGPIRNAIILTVARRIPAPPAGEEGHQQPTANGIAENGFDSISSDIHSLHRSTHLTDPDEIQKNTPGLPGCNPVIERLTGQTSDYGKGGGADESKRKPFPAGQEAVLIEGEYDPKGKAAEGMPNGLPAGSQLSLDESHPGFARDGFGRQSMSEKRHAQLDARSTGTYQRNKKAREEKQKDATTGLRPDVAVGPSLGLRKSSSLESLQTMIQELNKDDEAAKRALQSGSTRGSRSRGCNESFRAAVDRSYDAPPVAMETLDEESENGSLAGHLLTRSAELVEGPPPSDFFQEELLGMYARNGKSSSSKKKTGLLKGLGSVFKFGKNRKQSDLNRSKEDDDSDFSQRHHGPSSREHDRSPEPDSSLPPRRQLPPAPELPNRQERMQSLREQHQRMHQRRQGQYPLEQREEYYENELKEKENNYAMPFEVVHGRSHSLDMHKQATRGSKVYPSGDPNRYSHYMNYREIQQHIGHPLAKNLPKPPPEAAAFLDRAASQASDGSSNSLPRPPSDRSFFPHEHGNYGRMNVHPFYPGNNKLYSHIVPGSKV